MIHGQKKREEKEEGEIGEIGEIGERERKKKEEERPPTKSLNNPASSWNLAASMARTSICWSLDCHGCLFFGKGKSRRKSRRVGL